MSDISWRTAELESLTSYFEYFTAVVIPLAFVFCITGPKKLAIFLLAIAGVASNSELQKYLTWSGVFSAVFILGANLGSRAWQNMCLKKQTYSGPLYAVVASIKAFLVGLLFPYFGYRGCEPGGQVALENTLKSALLVAIVFILSGFREFGQLFIVGSEVCAEGNECNAYIPSIGFHLFIEFDC